MLGLKCNFPKRIGIQIIFRRRGGFVDISKVGLKGVRQKIVELGQKSSGVFVQFLKTKRGRIWRRNNKGY